MGQIYISDASQRRFQRLIDAFERGELGGSAQDTRDPSWSPDVQDLRVTGVAPVAGRYPAKVVSYNADADVKTDLGDCYAIDLNGTALTAGYYEGCRRWGTYLGIPVFTTKPAGSAGPGSTVLVGPQGWPGEDGEDAWSIPGRDGNTGLPGGVGATGATGVGLQGPPGWDGEDPDGGWVIPVPIGSAGGITGAGTDNHLMRWDGTTAAQDSNATLADTGAFSDSASIAGGNVGYFRNTSTTVSSTGLYAEASGATGAVFGIVGSTSSSDNGAYGGYFPRGGTDNVGLCAVGIDIVKMTAPATPPTGFARVYAKSTDSKIYSITDGGVESSLTSPFDDATAILKGNVDPTKLLRFEVDTYVPTGTTVVVTAPASASTIPIFTQPITFAGPTAARTYTLPDSAQTLAGLNVAQSWAQAQTFLNSSGIQLLDTNASHTLGLIAGSDLTGNRTFTITTGDASRLLSMGGDITTGGAITFAGAFGVTVTLTGTTSLTWPTSGTLATTTQGGAASYGDGSDGAVTFANDATDHVGSTHTGGAGTYVYTLTRDIFCTNLTIDATVTLRLGGFVICGTGTLTNNGIISAAGGNGGNGAAGTPGAVGAAGCPTANATYTTGGTLTGSNAGGLGASNGAGAAGDPTSTFTGYGGTGGAGGAATAPGGVTGLAVAAPTAVNGSIRRLPQLMNPRNLDATGQWRLEGAGGGGGGSNSANSGGGGGGGGGGPLALFFRIIINNGTISANGGNGGNGGGTSGNAGGGGAGGGGFVATISHSWTGAAPTVAAGAVGALFGAGANGAAGGAGVLIQVSNS